MEIVRGNIIIRTESGRTDDGAKPPSIEIVEVGSGRPICKLKIVGKGHAFGQEWVEELEFEEVPIESSKSQDEVAKGIVDLLKAKTEEDPLRAEDPYLLNHHPFKKGGPYPGPQKTGL